jgi:transcriptional regulator of acetoin/glycerol metabolism
MLAVDKLTTAQARAVRERGGTLPPEGLPPAEILDSWVRCMDIGLDPATTRPVPVVPAADLARRRERAAFVRRLAQAELETLAQQIAGSNFLLAFADRDGVILDVYADHRFEMSGSGAGIVAGSCWDEPVAGTNGLGTALATGRSVAVSGLQHYLFSLGGVSCTAAPVHDAAGELVGVLDASSYFESRQRHTQALVQMAAIHMENGLLLHQTAGLTVLAIHPRAEFLGTLSAGLLAFGDDGRVRAINARAASLLSGLAARRGTACEALFGEPFQRVLARLHGSIEVRLRDVLGSSLVASLVRPAARHVPPLGSAAQETAPEPAPARPDEVAGPLRRAVARSGRTLPGAAAGVVADDPAVAEAFDLVGAAAQINAPILIEGETGTGKELLARHAHACSGRRGDFVAVNCAALPAELFEAELFGYVPGAYTGARREGSAGLIASADGGTLLLDEVRDLPMALQAALLRFLDDRLVRPVGGTRTRRVDVQLLAATNVPLDGEVAARRFRDDLLYRLTVVKAQLPPLRCRSDFADAARATLAGIDPAATLLDDAVPRLARHGWPGNFRELRAVLTRALLACRLAGGPAQVGAAQLDPLLPAAGPAAAGSALRAGATERVRREFERCGRSISRTSRSLGISRTTVYRHLRQGGGAPGA